MGTGLLGQLHPLASISLQDIRAVGRSWPKNQTSGTPSRRAGISYIYLVVLPSSSSSSDQVLVATINLSRRADGAPVLNLADYWLVIPVSPRSCVQG